MNTRISVWKPRTPATAPEVPVTAPAPRENPAPTATTHAADMSAVTGRERSSRRNLACTFMANFEEERILRREAARMGKSFSTWAREHLVRIARHQPQ